MMAGRARHILAAAQDGIPEQNPTQRYLVLRRRVSCRCFRRGRQRRETQVVQRDILRADIGRKQQDSTKRQHADAAEDQLPHTAPFNFPLFTYDLRLPT
jgi:hypothetical protein